MKQNPHDPVITGLYKTDMSLAYFPKKELEMLLPRGMSIPSDEIMEKNYPTAKKIDGMHPFLLQGSTGAGVHPLIKPDYDSPSYEEIMFYFPVVYARGNEERLCSYVPALYLDYFFGVIIGNLYFKFRKEYRPEMVVEKKDTGRNYIVKNVISAYFNRISNDNKRELDPFFVQIFKFPTVTVSYLNKPYFYHTKVFSITKALDTSPVYEWNYKGSIIRNNEYTFGVYTEFTFTLSRVMSYNTFFHQDD